MIAQQQQHRINQQSADKSIFQACQSPNKIILNIKLHKILKQFPTKYISQYKINNIIPEGKYRQLQFGLCLDTKLLTIEIDKSYYYSKYFKKYQVILLCKNYLSVMEEFLAMCRQFLEKNIMEVKVLHFDMLSLSYVKDYKVINCRGQPQIKRVYIKISPFLYKRNFYIKIKQSQQLYSAVIRTIKQPTQQYQLPTNKQFYKAKRAPYVDQLYPSQSFIKRFPNRFYVFYQAFSLLHGLPLQNKYSKQYYAKCASKCMITSYRFKKIILNIKIPYIMEKQKDFKSTLIINCIQIQDEQTKIFKQILFYIEVPTKGQPNQRNIPAISSQNFLKNLQHSIKNPYDAQFISIKMQNNFKYIKIMNQVGFCRVFTQFYFYVQRLVFRNLRINKQIVTNSTNPNDNSILNFILPKTQQFIGKKFGHCYQIQIRSLYSFTQNNLVKNQDLSTTLPNKNKFHSVVMLKRKLAQDITRAVYQKVQFLHTNDQIKGLNYYVNQVLAKWSLADSNYHLVNFVYNYMNIIVDKNKQKQKNFYKNTTNWKAVIDDLSALVEMITKSLSSSHTTVMLYMLRTYEEFPTQSQYTKTQITEGQQVMTLTFKFMRLSIAGWVQVIPSCVYYFQMKKGFTILYHPELEKQVILESKKTKQFNERVFRDFLKITLENQYQFCTLPPLAYSKS